LTLQVCQIQMRQGTAAQWTLNNPTLLVGEWGYETDTGRIKIGDGVSSWSTLQTMPQVCGDSDIGPVVGTFNSAFRASFHITGSSNDNSGSLWCWSGGSGSLPFGGTFFRFLKCQGQIAAPFDVNPGDWPLAFEANGFDSGIGDYASIALQNVEITASPDGAGHIPCQWVWDWSGNAGANRDQAARFTDEAGHSSLRLDGPSGVVSFAENGSGSAKVVDPQTALHGDLETGDLSTWGPADASAQFHATKTDKGLLVPRLTTTQKLAIIGPANGLLVFDTTLGNFSVFRAGAWRPIPDPFTALTSGCKAWATTPIVTTNNAWFTLNFDNEYYDTDGYHTISGSNWQFIAPETGFYHVGCNINWAPSGTGARQLRCMYAPGGIVGPYTLMLVTQPAVVDSLFFTSQSLSTVVFLPAGSIVWFEALQHSGGNLNIVTALNSITDPAANSPPTTNPPTVIPAGVDMTFGIAVALRS